MKGLRLKPREPRLNVMIKARVRAGASWNDALILNMSSKGLLVRSNDRVNRGSYLEIRRGSHVIVARVIWLASDRFGVQTQDPVPAAALIRDPDGVAAGNKPAGPAIRDRRSAPRRVELRHEKSRQRGRTMEFTAVALACGAIALLIGNSVAEVASRPLSAVQAALASN